MEKKKSKKELIIEKPGKDGWNRSEELVLKYANNMFDILVCVLKKIEVSEFDSNEVYLLHNPDDKADDPWDRIVTLLSRYIKHLNSKYLSYLKKNNIKLPKDKQGKNNICVVEELKQVKTIK